MTTKIVITGPESTGKTTTAKFLAKKFNTVWLPEFAREYLNSINRKYTYEDVVLIAQRQITRELQYEKIYNLFFADTSLIIIKVWFEVVFGHYPYWIDKYILNLKPKLFLLMYPDIQWTYDPLRENPNKRLELFNLYQKQLNKINAKYFVIKGKDEQRLNKAYNIVENFLKNY